MSTKKAIPAIVPLAFAGTAFVIAGQASASGFALVEQSVKQVGSAISGGAASAEDASTIFFNPAGMTRLKGDQVVVGAHYIVPSAKFSGTATTTTDLGLLGGATISGGDGGDASGGALVPSFYYVHELNNQVMLGLGIGAPFGLKTDYDSSWAGRYHALKSDLQTKNINPSIAYKVNNKLSLGAGLNYMQASATLSNAVDYSTVCIGSVGYATCANPAVGLGTPANTATDGKVVVEGDSWSYGYNLGLLYELDQKTRIGVTYRSAVEQKLTGTADFTAPTSAGVNVPAPLAAVLADTDATAKVTLPASLSLSMTSQVAPEWELMADVTWTGWSSFDELRIEFDNPLKDDSVQDENWRDTYKVSVGFNYRHNAQWTWRGGVAYDQTPIKDAEHRTPRIPGNDRTWLAAGGSYQASPTVTVDFALAHLFVPDTDIEATEANVRHQLSGSYTSDVNIASVGVVMDF